MRKTIILPILFIAIASAPICHAAKSATPLKWEEATPHALSEKLLESCIKGDYGQSLKALFDTTQFFDLEEANIKVFASQFVSQLPMMEPYRRYELAKEEKLAPSLMKLFYVLYSDGMPIFFRFTYLKNQDAWELIDIKFSDKMSLIP